MRLLTAIPDAELSGTISSKPADSGKLITMKIDQYRVSQ